MDDRRVRKTKKSIQDAFIVLLKTYDLEEITIQQIADTADINRATFYKHYTDKFNLLKKIEENEINKLMAKFDPELITNLNIKSDKFLTKEVMVMPRNALAIIQENLDLYQTLFRMNRQSGFEEKLSELMARNIKIVTNNSSTVNGVPYDYFHKYVYGAMISVIKHWVLDENRIEDEEFLNHMINIMLNGPMTYLLNEYKK